MNIDRLFIFFIAWDSTISLYNYSISTMFVVNHWSLLSLTSFNSLVRQRRASILLASALRQRTLSSNNISTSSLQIKSFKNEIFATMYVSIFANLSIFISHFFFHQRFRWMNINWRVFHINSIKRNDFIMKTNQESNSHDCNFNEIWKKFNI